jgi:hypothetical protein
VTFIVLFFALLGVVLLGAGAAMLGHGHQAKLIFASLGAVGMAYICAWIAVTAVSKQPPLTVGNPQCIDNWCGGVEKVELRPQAATIIYDVTICIFSRAERAPTSFGAHAAVDASADFTLVDSRKRRYGPLPHQAEPPLNTVLRPGQFIRTLRTFELPADAREVGLIVADGSFGACPMIAECSTSHPASEYAVASGVYAKGSSFLALVHDLQRNASSKPSTWR